MALFAHARAYIRHRHTNTKPQPHRHTDTNTLTRQCVNGVEHEYGHECEQMYHGRKVGTKRESEGGSE